MADNLQMTFSKSLCLIKIDVWFVLIGSVENKSALVQLTHCGLVASYGDRDLGQHWFR